jgi:hypothetical protein
VSSILKNVSAVDPKVEFTQKHNPESEPLFSQDFSTLELNFGFLCQNHRFLNAIYKRCTKYPHL